MSHSHALEHIVLATPWLVALLEAVRDAGPAGAYVAAGAVRDTVWNYLTRSQCAGVSNGPMHDVDVVYFDACAEVAADALHQARLHDCAPQIEWEVTNQAYVHLWHASARGVHVPPHASLTAGLTSWPETATAVAVRLSQAGSLEWLAPLGLEDLFTLTLRHNPGVADAAVFWQRVRNKRWRERWPELTVIG